MRETNFIILTSLQSFNFHFRCYSILFLPLYLSFHLDSLHHHPDSPHFFLFQPRFPAFSRWFSAAAFPSHSLHSHPCPLHFPHSVLQFPIMAFTDSLLSLYSLRIYFRKIVDLLMDKLQHQIIISLIVTQVKNL